MSNSEFPVLKEAKREVMEDLMDIGHAKLVLDWIKSKKVKVQDVYKDYPSPFSFALITQGHADLLKIEDKMDFLRRMHKSVLEKIENK